MIPTRGQVKSRFLGYLDDPSGSVFLVPDGAGTTPFDLAFQEAYDALFNAFLNYQCPRIELIDSVEITPGTTSLIPANIWPEFTGFILLEERAWGSQDIYTELHQWDKLPQRPALDRLIDYVYRFDTFYFVGSYNPRELRITYESAGTAPTVDNSSINVEGSLTFLAKYAAAVAGPRKGYNDPDIQQYLISAVGPKYDQGVIGGELWRIIQPKVLQRQGVQVAPRPYRAGGRYGLWRSNVYIAAQQPAGSGMAPVQFSSADGTITGSIDGSNTQFFLSYPVATLDDVTVGGSRMTRNLDFTFGANLITFIAPSIPAPGSVITASGWV